MQFHSVCYMTNELMLNGQHFNSSLSLRIKFYVFKINIKSIEDEMILFFQNRNSWVGFNVIFFLEVKKGTTYTFLCRSFLLMFNTSHITV